MVIGFTPTGPAPSITLDNPCAHYGAHPGVGVIDNPRVGCAAEGGRKGDDVTAPGWPLPMFCPQWALPLAISHQGAGRVDTAVTERGREEWRTSARSPSKRGKGDNSNADTEGPSTWAVLGSLPPQHPVWGTLT